MHRPRAKKLRAATLPAARTCAVRLDSAPAPVEQGNGGRWIHIAYAGQWEGHRSGPFEFTPEDLAQMVANFQRHPQYRPGAEQATPDEFASSAYDVIPFDWRHLSTASAMAAPLELQVAQAWACELKVQKGATNVELWAFCRYLEPMATFVREGKVHWTSVTADPHFTDPVTGADMGWYIEAIAFTNDPFLQGLAVAADRKGEPIRALGGFDPYNAPTTAEEVLACLRELFELPATSDLGVVLAELAKLKAWSGGGAGAPPGVDVADLVGSLRRIFNLPTLADVAEVFAAADGLLAALAASSGPTAFTRDNPMVNAHVSKLFSLVATMLAIDLGRTPASDDDAVEAVREGLGKHKTVISLAADVAEKGKSSTTGLAAILTALGVEDVGGATKKITEMLANSAALLEAMPELAALKEKQGEDEDGDAEKDVGEAMAAGRIPESVKPALMFMRTGGVSIPKDKASAAYGKELALALVKRAESRKAFRAAYPPVDPRALALTRPSGVTTPSGAAPTGKGIPGVKALGTGAGDRTEINLNGYEGRNRFERAIDAAIKLDKKNGDGKLAGRPWAEKVRAGRELLASKDFVIVGGEG